MLSSRSCRSSFNILPIDRQGFAAFRPESRHSGKAIPPLPSASGPGPDIQIVYAYLRPHAVLLLLIIPGITTALPFSRTFAQPVFNNRHFGYGHTGTVSGMGSTIVTCGILTVNGFRHCPAPPTFPWNVSGHLLTSNNRPHRV
jgi:hypothetical protein